VRINSIKYKLNYNPAKYDYKSKRYVKKDIMYESFNKAKELQWECDKCKSAFSKYPNLKVHKTEKHSY
jgi:transcription initiation factor IIE alpha subunit